MNKTDQKIKYIIGTYRDDPDYPSKEDLFAMADKWYHLEGGKNFIHEYRGIPDQGETIFTLDIVNHAKLPKQKTNKLLSELIEIGDVIVAKETKHTVYHLINKR